MTVKLIGISPCYNELSLGHLDRFLNNIFKVVDGIVLMDDASTDGSYERMLEYTPNVLRNDVNRFIYEQDNTQRLINKALELYPDLTHILTLSIDVTFTPNCYKDGAAAIHKAVHDYPDVGMWVMHNVHLWRSGYWQRVDKEWRNNECERVYVRSKGLELANKDKVGLHLGKVIAKRPWWSVTGLDNEAKTIHWGYRHKENISKKFHHYQATAPTKICNPAAFRHNDMLRFLNEYDVELEPVSDSWFDSDILDRGEEKRKPRPVSFYQDIAKYDLAKANEYKAYFNRRLGFYTEDEMYET